MQTYNIQSVQLHQLTCAIPDGSGDATIRPGFYAHDKPKNFCISLEPGHNVVIGANRTPRLISEQTLKEEVVDPDETNAYPQADGSVRQRAARWKQGAFAFCSQMLRGTAAFPAHLVPYTAQPTGKKGRTHDQASQQQEPLSCGRDEAAAAAANAFPAGHGCASCSPVSLVGGDPLTTECGLSAQLGFRRWSFQVISMQY